MNNEVPQEPQNALLDRQRRAWTSPLVRRIDAGSAENAVNGTPDGAGNPS